MDSNETKAGPYTPQGDYNILSPNGDVTIFRGTFERDQIMKRLNAAYAAGQASREQQWMPVSENLPEGGEDVLVLTRWGVRDIAQRDWQQGWKPDHWSKDGKRAYEVEDVTHWMPLPQPPQNP